MLRIGMIVLAMVILVNIPACIRTDSGGGDAVLYVQPGNIQAGETSTISVAGRNLPRNISYQWRTDGPGMCTPQTSNGPETNYKAPDSIGESKKKEVTVSVEFYVNESKVRLQGRVIIESRGSIAEIPESAGSRARPLPDPPAKSASRPTIEITKPGIFDPEGGRMGPQMIEGKVSGVDSRDYVVLLYSRTNQWYIQPLDIDDGRFTPIDDRNGFRNDYHVGEQYAALLCRRPCENPPTKTPGLPLSNPNVVAWVIVDGVRKKD